MVFIMPQNSLSNSASVLLAMVSTTVEIISTTFKEQEYVTLPLDLNSAINRKMLSRTAIPKFFINVNQ